jgi:hypothetical protein
MRNDDERGIQVDALAGEDAASNQSQSSADGVPAQDPSAQAEFQPLPHEAWLSITSALIMGLQITAGLTQFLWGALVALLAHLLLLQYFYRLGSTFQQRGPAAERYWQMELIGIVMRLVSGSIGGGIPGLPAH